MGSKTRGDEGMRSRGMPAVTVFTACHAIRQSQINELHHQVKARDDIVAGMKEWLPNWSLYGRGALRGRLKVGDILGSMMASSIPAIRESNGISKRRADQALRKL